MAVLRELREEGALTLPAELWKLKGSNIADSFLKLVYLEQRHHLPMVCTVHGAPSTVYSNNAMTFRAASTCLQEVCDEDVAKVFLCHMGIKWVSQTPQSPRKVGFFERLIRVVKRTLATTLRRNLLTEEQLRTLIKEAEAAVNNRPLMYSGDMHMHEDEALTPSHLILGDVRLLPLMVPHEDMHMILTI
ncbi:uncharacterized protein LOC135215817 [Macrobrachium nipponense]|uniref:uncharacterized protein LOC135215817 n=1 Tax=Macrobrachium nipponense TaxID=159736 RepID=UPI0030C8AC22